MVRPSRDSFPTYPSTMLDVAYWVGRRIFIYDGIGSEETDPIFVALAREAPTIRSAEGSTPAVGEVTHAD